MFIGTVSFDYDTISIKCIINFCINFLQTVKCCCQVNVQAASLLKRNKNWNTFRVWLYEKQLGSLRLGGFPTHQDVADISDRFYFYSAFIWSRGMTPLPRSRLSKRNGMKKNQYKHFSQPVKAKIMQMRLYQFKLTKNLFLSRGNEHVSSLARWNRLYIDREILLSQTAYRDIFSI